ncbi:MAG: anaerobic glycerol-3-phosphate dehydrogenase subunit GlpB [Bacillota bacterium]
MGYDVAVIGAGLAGFSAATAAIKEGKKTIIVSKGLGNLYSASGYIDFLGYFPTTSHSPLENPEEGVRKLIESNPSHPYALVGLENIIRSFDIFLDVTKEIGLPYAGSLRENIMLPTAAGALVPTSFYPVSADKRLGNYQELLVVGIRELGDFYPAYVAQNLEKQTKRTVGSMWVELGLRIPRELNSFDLALSLEKDDLRVRLISQLEKYKGKNTLVLMPAVLGVNKWRQVIEDIEETLNCGVIEIPTLPPSVMGYRLAEAYKGYLREKGVEMIIGHPTAGADCSGGKCNHILISSASGREKVIKAENYCLATGGVLGEGLQVSPKKVVDNVFGLPVITPQVYGTKEFFSLESQPLAQAGIKVNSSLQPINPQTGDVILSNVFVAGATLAGYDPFVEKSGNGVAVTSGYKAGMQAAKGGTCNG